MPRLFVKLFLLLRCVILMVVGHEQTCIKLHISINLRLLNS